MTVLLIWEQVPEKTTMYLLQDLTQEEYDMIVKAHGQYVNTVDENEAVLWLNDFLEFQEDSKVEGPYMLEKAMVVVAGFAM